MQTCVSQQASLYHIMGIYLSCIQGGPKVRDRIWPTAMLISWNVSTAISSCGCTSYLPFPCLATTKLNLPAYLSSAVYSNKPNRWSRPVRASQLQSHCHQPFSSIYICYDPSALKECTRLTKVFTYLICHFIAFYYFLFQLNLLFLTLISFPFYRFFLQCHDRFCRTYVDFVRAMYQ